MNELDSTASSCTSRWIAASTPSIHGHAHTGALHAHTNVLMTSTRSHEAAGWRLALSMAALGSELALGPVLSG
jgi:hypothetical protein